ncbi:methylmalonyl-CoA epimerase [Thermoactinomyces sp. DSM 45891]|uniref:methylmalonyl-CoA epimerase n=1 Tax=Thermoactinomyces sp. DSM 45891 TaxID=1761907 RepID=UPI00092359A7|nr:methylmalonyl-CoA epimerase [Thermoactinomyces sp. DSM 45891]SFX04179.1 methylmalonyl-CoA epimerase [Thermoactinomyces sp. DSM 45891]
MNPKKISHIGIAVRSLEESIPFYEEQLGLPLTSIEVVESEQVKVAFFDIGESRIELLEPIAPSSAIAKFIEKRGEGLHHLALEVADIRTCLQNLREQGTRLIHEEPKAGAHQMQIAFLHPKSTHGALMELCQKTLAEME